MGLIDFVKEHPATTTALAVTTAVTGIAVGGALHVPVLEDACKKIGVCGETKTVNVDKPVDKWYNKTIDNSFGNLFNHTANITNDVFTVEELKAMHGNDTTDNRTWHYNVQALDPFIDWYALAKSLNSAEKKDLYGKSYSDLIQLAKDLGFSEGIATLYKGVRSAVADATSDLNDTIVKQLDAKPALDAILLGEKILAVDPAIDAAFADPLKATYLSHAGLSKADAYFNQDKFYTEENKADEYKWRTLEVQKIQADDLNNASGSARADALDTLVAYHTNYSWASDVNAFFKGPMDNVFKNAIKSNANLSKEAKDAILNYADLSGQNVSYLLIVDTPGKGAYVQAVKADGKTYFLNDKYRTGAVIKDSDVTELGKI